ncbi:MAG: hypothetical protein E7047_01385, partial [Lentisphaerae bacterium]|nr:hypothetical protein [Lentisphaerota bacterium]
MANLYDQTVEGGKELTVANGVTAFDTTVLGQGYKRGDMTIEAGGSASRTYLDGTYSLMTVKNGGSAVSTFVRNDGTELVVSKGAYTNSTVVKTGGVMTMKAGGSALNVNIENTGNFYLDVDGATYLTGTSHGKAVEVRNNRISNITVYGAYYMTVA